MAAAAAKAAHLQQGQQLPSMTKVGPLGGLPGGVNGPAGPMMAAGLGNSVLPSRPNDNTTTAWQLAAMQAQYAELLGAMQHLNMRNQQQQGQVEAGAMASLHAAAAANEQQHAVTAAQTAAQQHGDGGDFTIPAGYYDAKAAAGGIENGVSGNAAVLMPASCNVENMFQVSGDATSFVQAVPGDSCLWYLTVC